MHCEPRDTDILDFRVNPLRLGGIATADLGLFDFDINGDDVIVDWKNPSAWVDDHLVEAWGAPSNTVPYIGRFFRWAVLARSTTTHTTAPHLWAVAQDDWNVHIEQGKRELRQEVRQGLGLHPTPSIRAATALDSDETTLAEKQYVAGEPRPQRFKGGVLELDLECKTAALEGTAASNNSTSFGANCTVTVLLWCVLAQKSSEKTFEDLAAFAPEDDVALGRFAA